MTSPKSTRRIKTDVTTNGEIFHLLFANHPTPMWIYDLETLAFLDVNDAAVEKYGYTRDEFLALTIKDIRPEEDVKRLINTLEQKRAALNHSGEWRHRLKNGQVIDVEITTHTLDFEGHHAKLVTAQDITERKRAEEVLAQQNNALLKLNNFSIELSMLPSEDDLEALIVRQLKEIAVAEVTTFSEYDPANRTTTPTHIELKPELLRKVIGLLGKQVNNIHSFVSDETYRDITSETIGTRKNLYEASFGAIPRPVGAAIQALVNVDRFIGIAYVIEGKLYGISLLGMGKDQPDPPRKILENFIHLATLSLRRRQAENALNESEKRFATIFRANPAAIAITRLDDDHLVDVNAAWQRMTGYMHTEVVGRTPQELDLWVDLTQRNRLIKMVGEHGKAHGEMELRQKSGEIRDWLMSADLIELNGARYLLIMAQDITESKRAKEALAESEKKFRTLFETMSEGVVYEGHDGKIISANSAAERLLGLSFNQLQGRTSVDPRWKAIHADGSPFPGETHSLNVAAKTGKPATGEVMGIYNPKLGSYIWLSVNSTPEFLPGEKKPFQAYAVFRDITERKQAEENLIASEVRYRRLFEAARDGILILDAETGVIVDVNPFLCEMLGFSHEELCGKELWELGFFKDIAENKANFLELQEKGYIRYDDLPLEIANGRKFHVEFVSNVYNVNHHKVVQCNIRDITERKQTEQKLAQYSEHLEEMVEARTLELREAQEKLVRNEKLAVLGQLAGGVGHELRNPLAVINNALYYLKLIGANGNEKVKEYLGIIQTETRTAEKIITDLLDFARVKSVDREPVSASELVNLMLKRFPVHPSVQVALEIPEELPKVFVDPRQMEQVLGNLVINACQAMTTGVVSTGSDLVISAYQDQEMIAIAVKDSGMGISPENMEKIFEPLFTTKAKGIGLGLAVSQKLVEANSGRLEVQSEAGVGSTFTVYLPVKV